MEKTNLSQPYSSNTSLLVTQSGISPHLLGFATTCVAAELMTKRGLGQCKFVSDLYPEIAAMFGTTPYGVERNIRTAINFAWSNGALKHFYEGLGLHIEKRPSNSAFISQLARILLSESEREGNIKVSNGKIVSKPLGFETVAAHSFIEICTVRCALPLCSAALRHFYDA